MLTYRKSLECREFNSREYIKLALKSKFPEKLDFTGSEGDQFSHVMTKEVLIFMVKTLTIKNKIYSLNLNKCNIDDSMVKILVGGNWQSLTELYLFNNNLTKLSLDYFKQAKWKKLQILDLGRNPFVNVDGKSFVKSLPETLVELELSELSLSSKFMKELSENPWRQMRELNLSKNSLQNHGLIFLVKSDWPNLQFLDLESNFITNDGCKALRRGVWRCLKRLYLNGNFLEGTGIEQLSRNQWSLLQQLSIRSKRFLTNEMNYSIQRHIFTSVTISLLRFDNSLLTVQHLYPSYYDSDNNPIENMILQRGRIKIV